MEEDERDVRSLRQVGAATSIVGSFEVLVSKEEEEREGEKMYVIRLDPDNKLTY